MPADVFVGPAVPDIVVVQTFSLHVQVENLHYNATRPPIPRPKQRPVHSQEPPMSNRIPLELIEVETPCTKDWNRMRGSNEKRFCDHCNRDVYDLGAMSRAAEEQTAP